MKIEPKMAIACRDKIEIDVVLNMFEKANITWAGGEKATDAEFLDDKDECRLYVYPPDEFFKYTHIVWDECCNDSYDSDDSFTWNYLEASDIFNNQIISERRRNGITT